MSLSDRYRPLKKTVHLSSRLRSALAGGVIALAGMAGSQAQTSYLSLDKTGLWSDASLWTTSETDPAKLYPHLDGHQAHIGESSGQRVLTIDQNLTLEMLNIWGGRILTPGSGSQTTITIQADPGRPGSVPEFRVAVQGTPNTAPNIQSTLNLQSGLHINLIGGVMNFGEGTRAGYAWVTLESGASLTAGTALNRTRWTVGRQLGIRADTRESFLVGEAGSEFTGYFSSVTIGAVDSGSGGPSTITGRVDLTQATVHAFDVSGNVLIGKGATLEGSHGKLLLPEVNAVIGGNLIIGDTWATNSSGLLDLRQTHVDVGGGVTLNLTGKVKVTIDGKAAGLSLSSDSAFLITARGTHAGDADAGYFMQFEGDGPTGEILYGLAWEGNHLTELQALIDAFAITWTSSSTTAPGLFYDETLQTTFIGYAAIPEPGSLSLLAAVVLIFTGIAKVKGRRP